MARTVGSRALLGSARAPSRSGAALVEVLVVVGIVVVLAGLVGSAAWVVRERARAVQCAGNLHALYLAMKAYAADYDDFMPLAWFDKGRFLRYLPMDRGLWGFRDIDPPMRIEEPPPRWYTIKVSMGDYVDDKRVFDQPGEKSIIGDPKVPETRVGYFYQQDCVDLRFRELNWPAEYLCCMRCRVPHRGFGGLRVHRLYLDGHVKLSRNAVFYPIRCGRIIPPPEVPWEVVKKWRVAKWPEIYGPTYEDYERRQREAWRRAIERGWRPGPIIPPPEEIERWREVYGQGR